MINEAELEFLVGVGGCQIKKISGRVWEVQEEKHSMT